MERIYFIADTHFGDDGIRRYENRPFASTAEMDESIINNWNSTVEEGDTVYVLGDFGADGCESRILARLLGKKILVKGNHDIRSNEYYRACGFSEVYDLPVIFRSFWILSHDSLYINRNMPYANLFGHVHANPAYKDLSSQHYCVCVERIGYTPILFEDIAAAVKRASVEEEKK